MLRTILEVDQRIHQKMDKRTRKLMSMQKDLHSRDDVDISYVNFAVVADQRVRLKESEKDKYLDLARKLKTLWT